MRVLVISHTPHYKMADGKVVGWGPTVRELNILAERYGHVVHIACMHEGNDIPASMIGYNDNVRFVPIKPFGGKGVMNKLNIVFGMFRNLSIIRKELKNADVFQFRAPTSIGLYIIPYFSIFCRKPGWYKYAGNWNQYEAPLSYRLQKWMLSVQKRIVTINGKWENQPVNCKTFENPCLYDADVEAGMQHVQNKISKAPYRLCYVGSLDSDKGIYEILSALKSYENKTCFTGLDIVGDGVEASKISVVANTIPIPVKMHGSLKRDDVFDIYKQSDFILLPSRSEGFPKVIAEAANYGCIPIVSDVSAIGQYVNTSNGYLWNSSIETFSDFFSQIDFSNEDKIQTQTKNAHHMASGFTYANYIMKLEREIIPDFDDKKL